MEKFVKEGKIRWYGIASWNSFRVAESDQAYISLAKCVDLAKAIGGDHHHFRFVQIPFNLGMPEAYGLPTQLSVHEHVPPLRFAQEHGIAAIASASLYQGQLTHDLPEWLVAKIGMATDAERALQFARSAPGIITALVGMGKPAHVLENIRAASTAPLTAETFAELFARD